MRLDEIYIEKEEYDRYLRILKNMIVFAKIPLVVRADCGPPSAFGVHHRRKAAASGSPHRATL